MGTRSTVQLIPYVVKKAGATTIADNLTWVTDAHLKFTADGANEIWYFRLLAFITCNAADSFKFRFTNDNAANASVRAWEANVLRFANHGAVGAGTGMTVTLTGDLTGADGIVIIEGDVESTAAGDIEFEWIKAADAGADMIVSPPSILEARRIS